MEDDRTGYKELLVAKSNKRCREICRRVLHMLTDKEQDRENSREVQVEQSTGKAMNSSNSRLYHKVTNSSWEECNPGSL